METEPISTAPDRPVHPVMDMADLVSLVVCLDGPSRDVDEIVEAMLGGDEAALAVSTASVIAGRWLSGETPAYTGGGQSLSVLAHRRGYRVSASKEASGFRAEAWIPGSSLVASASGRTEGGAGIAAVASLAIKEKKIA